MNKNKLIRKNNNKNDFTKFCDFTKTSKYLFLGLIIILAIKYILGNKLKNKEIMMIGLISIIIFAILEQQ